MTPEKILEFNKLCCLFLNWKFNPTTSIHFPKGTWIDLNGIGHCAEKGLKFHSDWNWIMEVVEAIEINFPIHTLQWEYDDREEFAKDGRYKAYWFTLHPKDEICSGLTDLRNKSRKEAVVQAINQFLIWYNENAEA